MTSNVTKWSDFQNPVTYYTFSQPGSVVTIKRVNSHTVRPPLSFHIKIEMFLKWQYITLLLSTGLCNIRNVIHFGNIIKTCCYVVTIAIT